MTGEAEAIGRRWGAGPFGPAPDCMASRGGRAVYTVGHSTRALDELIDLLRDAGVEALADVRRFPGSRRHPQFNRGSFEESCPERGIEYHWLGESLGGRRREVVPVAASPNRAWQVAAFRHYADAIPTPEFVAGMEELERIALRKATAFMCAERRWWQCHRRLLSDVMLVRGWTVVHLLERGKSSAHELTGWARVEEGVLTYPGLL